MSHGIYAEGLNQLPPFPLTDTSPVFYDAKAFGSGASLFQTSNIMPSALVAQRLLPSFDIVYGYINFAADPPRQPQRQLQPNKQHNLSPNLLKCKHG